MLRLLKKSKGSDTGLMKACGWTGYVVVLGLTFGCDGGGSEGASGGNNSGGTASSTGGSSTGGSSTGGSSTGGSSTGGSSTGGSSTAGGGQGTGGSTSGGSGGATSGGSGSGAAESGGSAGSDGGGGGSTSDCSEDCEGQGFICCHGVCINPGNDIRNCGRCDVTCDGNSPYCDNGVCGEAPCGPQIDCVLGATCCSVECCTEGQLCCFVNVGPGTLGCVDAVDGTCPKGCPSCVCAAPDTPIATPIGEVPISELRVGDLVYSMDEYGIVTVPIERVNRTPVHRHTILAIVTEDGRTLKVSPGHPLADGRLLSDVHPGERLLGIEIRSVTPIAYDLPETFDILPGSSTGTYFAAGVPLGSTLR